MHIGVPVHQVFFDIQGDRVRSINALSLMTEASEGLMRFAVLRRLLVSRYGPSRPPTSQGLSDDCRRELEQVSSAASQSNPPSPSDCSFSAGDAYFAIAWRTQGAFRISILISFAEDPPPAVIIRYAHPLLRESEHAPEPSL